MVKIAYKNQVMVNNIIHRKALIAVFLMKNIPAFWQTVFLLLSRYSSEPF
jgi:hypothetical protein